MGIPAESLVCWLLQRLEQAVLLQAGAQHAMPPPHCELR